MDSRPAKPFKGRIIHLHPPCDESDRMLFKIEHGPRDLPFAIELHTAGKLSLREQASLSVKLLYTAAEHGWRVTVQPEDHPPYGDLVRVRHIAVDLA